MKLCFMKQITSSKFAIQIVTFLENYQKIKKMHYVYANKKIHTIHCEFIIQKTYTKCTRDIHKMYTRRTRDVL